MSAVLVFGTCVPVEGVRALADDGAAQSVASQGESPLNQRGGQGGSDSNGASSQDSASAGEKDQDVPASKSVSRKDSGTSPPAQGDKPSAAPAAAQAKKTAAANASAAPASLVAVYVDGTNGNDANDGSSFDGKAVKTLAKALHIQAANKSVDTIYVKGSLSLSATASIPSGATLSVASEGATISSSGNSIDGIVLKSGSTLTGAGKLTMTGFKTALTSEKGSTITDGTYVLKDNAGKSGALFGAQASGSIVFGENCLVETPAKSNADNGAGQTGKNFVVTGGSYLVKYATGYNSSYGSTFSKDSVFKKNPDVFAISTDKGGARLPPSRAVRRFLTRRPSTGSSSR